MKKTASELHELFEKKFMDESIIPSQYRGKFLFSDRMFMEKMFREAYEEGLKDSIGSWKPVPKDCKIDLKELGKDMSHEWVIVMDMTSNIDICEVLEDGTIDIKYLMDTHVDREGEHLYLPIPVRQPLVNMRHLGWNLLEDILSVNVPEDGEVLYVVTEKYYDILVTSFENGKIKDMTIPGTDEEVTEKDVKYYFRKGAKRF